MGLHNFSLSNDAPDFGSKNPSFGMMCESVDIEISNINNGLLSNDLKLSDTPENSLVKHIAHHKVMYNRIENICDMIRNSSMEESMKDWIDTVESLVMFCNRDFVDIVNMLKCYGNIIPTYGSPKFIDDSIVSLMKLALLHKTTIENDRSLNAIDTMLYQTDMGMSLFIHDEVLNKLADITKIDSYEEFRTYLTSSDTVDQCMRYLDGYFNHDNIIGGYYYESRKRVMIYDDINERYKEINRCSNNSCNNPSRECKIDKICDNAFNNIRSILGEIYSIMCDITDNQNYPKESFNGYYTKMVGITNMVRRYYSMLTVLQIHYFIVTLNKIIEKLAIQDKHSEIVRVFFSR